MQKYYWYVNADTDVIGGYFGSIKPYIKRAISPPISGKPYIVEIVNGYRHSIKQNDGMQLAEINDNGNIGELSTINNLIISHLTRLVEDDKKKKNKDKNRSINSEAEELMERYPSLFMSDELDLTSMRRKKRITSRLNRSSPKKKKVTKKRK
jgi:hypothetical protein